MRPVRSINLETIAVKYGDHDPELQEYQIYWYHIFWKQWRRIRLGTVKQYAGSYYAEDADSLDALKEQIYEQIVFDINMSEPAGGTVHSWDEEARQELKKLTDIIAEQAWTLTKEESK